MLEIYKLLIGILVLLLAIPIGNLLAKYTKEELVAGKKYFRIIVLVSLALGLVGLIIGNDVLLFSCFFIALATSQSLRKKHTN